MWLSDTSVRRPVLASVLSLLLLAFGLLAFDRLPLREYPDIDPPVVSVQTVYRGASPQVVESRITRVIEERLAGVEGIKSLNSTSSDGLSLINIEFSAGRDIDGAANDVRERVSAVMADMPEGAESPEVQKADADAQVIMWLNLVSEDMSIMQLSDYANRYVKERFSVLDGVARVAISGNLDPAMRVWLDRKALAARGLTVSDVEAALRAQNVDLPGGSIKSPERDFSVRLDRQYRSAQDFAALVIQRGRDGYLLRLGDVARVEEGPEESRKMYRGNGVNMVGIGIVKQSTANALEVARAARAEAERVQASLPAGMQLLRSFDSTVFVETAVREVYITVAVACALVVLVIFLFLGDWRAMLVPVATLPVSLAAGFIVLHAAGYSLNMLTLLALVLAIGLVVDDGIVVLENVHRRIRAGEPPLAAAFRGTRQVGFAVVATTLVLAAVFLPITFLQGNVGRLFGEFAVAMAASVLFSALVALTLCPALASRLLRPGDSGDSALDGRLLRLRQRYRRALESSLDRPWRSAALVLLVLAAIAALFARLPAEFAPREDRGVMYMVVTAPEGSSFDYTQRHMLEVEKRLLPLVESGEMRRLLVRAPSAFTSEQNFNQGVVIMVLEDWGQRRPIAAILADVRKRVADLPGVQAFPITPQGLGGRMKKPVQFVIGGPDYASLAQWRDLMLEHARKNPRLTGLDYDYKETKPELRLRVDRARAGSLGVRPEDVGRTLETLFASRRVTTFERDGEEYDVILEVDGAGQLRPEALDDVYVRAVNGQQVRLANVVTVEEKASAASLNRYNRVRSVTLEATLAEGYTLGEALAYLEQGARQQLPPEARIGYKGESLEFKDSQSGVRMTFLLALLVVFLVLAAQFESFVSPLVVMLTVPLAVAGGLLGLYACGLSLNLYSQIGIIMLVGLAAKNGILIVEFCNQLRDEGLALREALLQACELRLRPILMTSLTAVMGAVPLMLAAGAGSEVRQVIGVVVVFGVSFSTALTLFLVPVAYQWLARRQSTPLQSERALQRQLEQHPEIDNR